MKLSFVVLVIFGVVSFSGAVPVEDQPETPLQTEDDVPAEEQTEGAEELQNEEFEDDNSIPDEQFDPKGEQEDPKDKQDLETSDEDKVEDPKKSLKGRRRRRGGIRVYFNRRRCSRFNLGYSNRFGIYACRHCKRRVCRKGFDLRSRIYIHGCYNTRYIFCKQLVPPRHRRPRKVKARE